MHEAISAAGLKTVLKWATMGLVFNISVAEYKLSDRHEARCH